VDGDVAGRQRRLLERGALDRRAPVRLLGHQSRERVSHGAGTMAPGGTKLQSEGRKCCSLTLAGTLNASRIEGLLALACRSQEERDRAALGSWGVAERGRFPAERLLAFHGRRAGSAHASAHALVRTERTAGAENTARGPRPLRAVEVPQSRCQTPRGDPPWFDTSWFVMTVESGTGARRQVSPRVAPSRGVPSRGVARCPVARCQTPRNGVSR